MGQFDGLHPLVHLTQTDPVSIDDDTQNPLKHRNDSAL